MTFLIIFSTLVLAAQAADSAPLVVEVSAAGCERYDKPVEVDLGGRFGDGRLRVVEVDADGRAVDEAVPFQLDKSTLVFLMKGTTPGDVTRRYRVEPAERPPKIEPLITLTEVPEYQEQASYKIVTRAATYYYHKEGAGFASMIDRDGDDWISFRPYGGADGKYRGIPNLVHPENYFHPGGTGCISRITASGPLKVTIHSESKDGKWATQGYIYPHYATLTVLKVDREYWFLYEGTPAGKLDEQNQYIVRSSGEKTTAAERWDGDLPDPEWLYFGDTRRNRVLYIVHHDDDDAIDSYWPMQGQMTVFGFGRLGLKKFLEAVPNRFTVGFAEDEAAAEKVIDSAFRELAVEVREWRNNP